MLRNLKKLTSRFHKPERNLVSNFSDLISPHCTSFVHPLSKVRTTQLLHPFLTSASRDRDQYSPDLIFSPLHYLRDSCFDVEEETNAGIVNRVADCVSSSYV